MSARANKRHFGGENVIPSSLQGRHYKVVVITRFGKNVVVSKRVNNTVAVFHFLISKKAQLPAIRTTEKPTLLTKSKINRPGKKRKGKELFLKCLIL